MLETTFYTLGLLLRLGAFAFAVVIVLRHRSWRYLVIALGIFWISLQPILQYFFSSSSFVSEIPRPEIFLITSAVALFVIYHFYTILEDNQRYQQKETDELARASRRNSVLLDLAKQRTPDLQFGLAAIATKASHELGVDRVSVWLFNDAQTEITSLILIDKGAVSPDTETISAKEFPAYFKALLEDSVIVADDAQHHPATLEFFQQYLEPHNIHSMMDIPMRLDGDVIGIICFEQSERVKHWTLEDQDFGHAIADLCALAIANDGRRAISLRLEDSDRHLRNAQDAGQFGSFRWELDGNNVIWSGETMREIGFSDDRELSYEEFRTQMDPGEAERYATAVLQAARKHTPLLTRFRMKRDNQERHYEIRANYRELDSGGCFEGTIQNITEQVLAEKETQRLEAQLIQSQKMESIGTLAGGIAHDFNNILTPILGYTDIALSETPADSPLHGTLEIILHSSLRAKELVEQILVFGRRWEEKRIPLDIEESIKSALKLVRPTLPTSIHIELDITPGYKLVEADSTQMVQILVNLCTNAWHAMDPDGGVLCLRLYASDNGQQTILEVSDTGSGIEPEAIKRIFDPFYTTKDVGQGTGLGLAVVHGIITKLGGEIQVTSELKNFTTFKLIFPTTDKALPEPETVPQSETQSESASILVVDDNEAVAGILKSMLIDLGYEVDVYLDSQEALSSFQQASRHYDALLTDLTMPNMSGIELTRRIREAAPELPVFIVSGYGGEQFSDQIKDLKRCHVVSKPFTKDDLAKVLYKELH